MARGCDMACTNPHLAYKFGVTENGKQRLIFKRPDGFIITDENTQQIPCGKCISCKLSYAKEWALRICHEIAFTEFNSFVTLTYNDENLPKDKSVHKYEVQNFVKRLRKYLQTKYGSVIAGYDKNGKAKYSPTVPIKVFYCGEYGSKRDRPHYHVIIMGYDFTDKYYSRTSPAGHVLWESDILNTLWTKGFANIGEVTYESAAYVARYCMKKVKDKKSYEFVESYDKDTGELLKIGNLEPEFIGMSKGIGKKWYEIFRTDTEKDYITQNGFKHKIPRYYDKLAERNNAEELEKRKEERQKKAIDNKDEYAKRRQLAKNEVKKAQAKMLVRSLENNGS